MSSVQEIDKSVATSMVAAQRRLDWVMQFVDIADASGDPESHYLNPNQIFTILDHHQFEVVEKGRQQGHSFGFALDSIAGAVIEEKNRFVHISTDKWEAQNKQIYGLRILDSLSREGRRYARVKSESKERIELSNGSRIDFLACRPPRGVSKGHIYLDESAFMPNIEAILKASIAATLHGGYIRIGSTHCGAQSEFYQMARNIENEAGRRPYAHWNRGYFPWWTCPTLCVDVVRAINEAPGMDTAERVERFGNIKLKTVFMGYPIIEDFQEEMECIASDALHAFYPMGLITSCQPLKPEEYWFEFIEVSGSSFDTIEPAKDLVNLLAREIKSNNLRGQWYFAQDVGHTIDKDEITIGSDDNGVFKPRLMISMSRMPFEKKEQLIHHIMNNIPIQLGLIDATGMGTQIGQTMNARYGSRCEPLVFDNNNKAIMANDLKIKMESQAIVIPVMKSLIRQIHAIKKTTTRHKREIYDVENNKEHHGDKFWSLAMCASLAGTAAMTHAFPITVSRLPGPRGIPGIHSPGMPLAPRRSIILGSGGIINRN